MATTTATIATSLLATATSTRLPSPARTHHPGRPKAHFATLVDESISQLVPFSALILTLCVVVVFAYRLYFIEAWLMNTKLYKPKYHQLNHEQQRSLVNHHVAGTLKISLLFIAIYPFLSVAFGHATPHTPFAKGAMLTMGDIMVVCSNLFTTMYVFELFYRVNISYISVAHHIGAMVIAQVALTISLDFAEERDAVLVFVMCFVWGAFDVLAELWPHLAIIMYRLLPLSDNTPVGDYSTQKLAHNHLLMSRVFLFTCYVETGGTIWETIVIFWLFGVTWDRWTMAFKIVIPALHLLFTGAQLWGAHAFRQLSKKESRRGKMLLRRAREELDSGQRVEMKSEESVNRGAEVADEDHDDTEEDEDEEDDHGEGEEEKVGDDAKQQQQQEHTHHDRDEIKPTTGIEIHAISSNEKISYAPRQRRSMPVITTTRADT